MNTKIKNIIFDLGGVILDIDETIVYKELGKMGINTTELAHSKEFIEIMSKFDTGIYTAPTFRKRMKALIGQEKMTDEKFDSIWNAMLLDIPRERSHRKSEETLQDFPDEQHECDSLRLVCQGFAVAFRL